MQQSPLEEESLTFPKELPQLMSDSKQPGPPGSSKKKYHHTNSKHSQTQLTRSFILVKIFLLLGPGRGGSGSEKKRSRENYAPKKQAKRAAKKLKKAEEVL